MNRFLARTLASGGLAVALAGCAERYRNAVDPCWPQRYNFTARKEVVDAFAPQVQNGEILDQTIWNYMFVAGTDELNGMGTAKLNYIIRRRPAPDPNIFIQTAQDVSYDPKQPDRLAEARRELDYKRISAIQRYLNAQLAGRPAVFEFAIHDPFPVGANSSYSSGTSRLATTAATSGVLGSLSGGAGSTGTAAAQGGAPNQQQQGGGGTGAPGGAGATPGGGTQPQ